MPTNEIQHPVAFAFSHGALLAGLLLSVVLWHWAWIVMGIGLWLLGGIAAAIVEVVRPRRPCTHEPLACVTCGGSMHPHGPVTWKCSDCGAVSGVPS